MTPPVHPPCACGHLDVLHNLSSSGRRTGCSISTGPHATPCGCRAYEQPDDTQRRLLGLATADEDEEVTPS